MLSQKWNYNSALKQTWQQTTTEKPIYIQEVNIDYDTILAF
jgi:hypothetical protein